MLKEKLKKNYECRAHRSCCIIKQDISFKTKILVGYGTVNMAKKEVRFYYSPEALRFLSTGTILFIKSLAKGLFMNEK